MAKMTIVGSGILGLSVAEFLSREMFIGHEIQIVTNQHPFAGSNAAAANLATKGQLFGRDKHFQLKLEGKKIYPKWILQMLQESQNKTPIEEIYRNGFGVDYFTSKENRDKHFKRVKQNEEDLFKRKLPNQPIMKIADHKLRYEDEAWIDAHFLISMLNEILQKRGIKFTKAAFGKEEYHKLLKSHDNEYLIFCTGAWTKSLLNYLEIKLPIPLEKQERFTVGSTFFGKKIYHHFDQDVVLHEFISGNLKEKITVSGNQRKGFVSSSTVKISNIFEFNAKLLEAKNNELLELFKNAALQMGFSKNHMEQDIELNISKLDGFRVGYGHSEILLEKLEIPNARINASVCAGAHKSGYLFAPVVGSMMQNLLLGICS